MPAMQAGRVQCASGNSAMHALKAACDFGMFMNSSYSKFTIDCKSEQFEMHLYGC